MINIKKILVNIITISLLVINHSIYAEENNIVNDIGDSFQIYRYLDVFEDYMKNNNIDNINTYDIYNDLISGRGINYKNIFESVISNLIGQIKESLASVSSIFVIIVITALLSSLEMDKSSSVIKVTKLIVLICISSILLKNYLEIVSMFKEIVNILSYSMQIVSTFLTGILIATGKITSTGIIQPLLTFIANGILVVCNYFVIPFFSLAITINIISKIGDDLKLDRLSSIFRKSSLYIFSSIIAIFILILSMESSVTKSIDNIFFKTTQNLVSDVVPVVGKFLSDSLDTVLGATELIGKVGGIVAIISVILLVSVPVIKLLIIIFMYKILSAISEPINEDKTIIDFIDGFSNVYKDILGILIGIMTLFVMTTGIIMSMMKTIGV